MEKDTERKTLVHTCICKKPDIDKKIILQKPEKTHPNSDNWRRHMERRKE